MQAWERVPKRKLGQEALTPAFRDGAPPCRQRTQEGGQGLSRTRQAGLRLKVGGRVDRSKLPFVLPAARR